jgi:amino acid transporter
MDQQKSTETETPHQGTLGTFSGVFTPSILTILGIILFLRLGYVVGSAGLYRSLLIIALANAISVLTSLSLSAVATNLKVKGGGDYYLISRTLGVEFGGAIGLVLFLAQSVSIAFYCIGFAEALSARLTILGQVSPPIIALAAIALLFVFAWLGADWATRFQYGVMVLLGAALVSFFLGTVPVWDKAMLAANWSAPDNAPGLWVLFAVFFPAVTGFTQGVSMSGDLKDPGRSLPLGTFSAVGLSIVVYFTAAVLFSGVLPNARLMTEYDAMKQVARWGILIDIGVVAATLSSAMASFLGAPRIMQSLAADRIFGFLTPFEKGSGRANNPRRAVLLSCGIAVATLGLGQLNLIAQVVSMFFLVSYGLLNYATFFEARSASPSFRPRFRWFNQWLSLLGAVTCLGVMLAIDLEIGLVAIAILMAIYQYLKRTAGTPRWADSRRSHHLQRAREHLLGAASKHEHNRDWRPHIIALTNDEERRVRLLTLATWIEGRSGTTSAVRLILGQGAEMRRRHRDAESRLIQTIHEAGLRVFPLVFTASDFTQGLRILVQTYGIGPLKANTILVNWPDQTGRGIPGLGLLRYGQNLRMMFHAGLNLVVFHSDKESWDRLGTRPEKQRRIDVWWHNDSTSRLMLLLAYLTTRSTFWDDAVFRVISAGSGENWIKASREFKEMLDDARINAQPEIVPDITAERIAEYSADAALVFLPFRIRRFRLLDLEGQSLDRLLMQLPPTVLVMAAEEIDLDAEPEEGPTGELAAVMDAWTAAEEKADHAESEAQRLQTLAEKGDHADAATTTVLEPGTPPLSRENRKALDDAQDAARRAAKARAKADAAAQRVAELSQITDDKKLI